MVYRPPRPLKVDADALVNTSLPEITVSLVDQDGKRLTSLLGEKYSCVVVIEWVES